MGICRLWPVPHTRREEVRGHKPLHCKRSHYLYETHSMPITLGGKEKWLSHHDWNRFVDTDTQSGVAAGNERNGIFKKVDKNTRQTQCVDLVGEPTNVSENLS